MTKEELKQEAEEYRKEKLEERKDKFVFELPEVYVADIKRAYLAGAEPREKRIADLEKENAELKEKLEMGIALKDEEIGCIQTDFNTFKSKAKELLAKWVELYKPKSKTALPTPIQADTEQFLKESE